MATKKINDEIYYILSNTSKFKEYLLDESSDCYNLRANYILETNINFEEIDENFRIPIKKFFGKFDGNNFGIYNLNNELFLETEDSTISNLILSFEDDINVENDFGCFIKIANSTIIKDCFIDARANIVSSGSNIGILCGITNKCDIRNVVIKCTNSIIRANSEVAGFIGKATDTCIYDSLISGKLSILGNTGPLILTENIAGFVALSENCYFENCNVNFKGTLTGLNNVSGFVSQDLNSVFKYCCMEFDGSINGLTTNLFCVVTLGIDEEASVFYLCSINITT